MKVLSVNVGKPRPIFPDPPGHGRAVLTGIFKSPVEGPVRVGTLNLEGDQQADLTVHGGVFKAVYAYPSEHYEFWRNHYAAALLNWGAFGENLSTEGLREDAVSIGDQLQVGTAVLTVTQPRLPCFKSAAKFQDQGILQKFTDSGRSGIYFAVEREGEIQSGDTFKWVRRDPEGFTIADAMRFYNGETVPASLLERALAVQSLPEWWRKQLREALDVRR